MCGAVAGGTSKVIVHPLDTVKKRMQVTVSSHPTAALSTISLFTPIAFMVLCTLS
jgi:hypothetical protein